MSFLCFSLTFFVFFWGFVLFFLGHSNIFLYHQIAKDHFFPLDLLRSQQKELYQNNKTSLSTILEKLEVLFLYFSPVFVVFEP